MYNRCSFCRLKKDNKPVEQKNATVSHSSVFRVVELKLLGMHRCNHYYSLSDLGREGPAIIHIDDPLLFLASMIIPGPTLPWARVVR